MKINILSFCCSIIISCNFISTTSASYPKNLNNKYILIWSLPNYDSMYHVKNNKIFVQSKCRFKNCFFIHDKRYFKDMKNFDAILFYAPTLLNNSFIYQANKNRSPRQIYIFASHESAHNYPVCFYGVDGFFNLTWTYRLDSNLPSPYILVKDKNGKIVGPNENMNWIKLEDMKDISEDMKNKLRKKHKPMAWFVSACTSLSNRNDYVLALNILHRRAVDVYGACGGSFNVCGKSELLLEDCNKIIEDDYFFYLAFENSFSKDYVTEKVIRPLRHYTVPIVLGTANYTRFMPDGIYLNAMEFSPRKLLSKVYEIMNNEEEYFSFFKWHNHYSFYDPNEFPETNNLCQLCYMLNDEIYTAELNAYEDFRDWWNEPSACPGIS